MPGTTAEDIMSSARLMALDEAAKPLEEALAKINAEREELRERAARRAEMVLEVECAARRARAGLPPRSVFEDGPVVMYDVVGRRHRRGVVRGGVFVPEAAS